MWQNSDSDSSDSSDRKKNFFPQKKTFFKFSLTILFYIEKNYKKLKNSKGHRPSANLS